MTKQIWLLVANGSEALLYKYLDAGTRLEELGGVGKGTRRQRNQDLVTDRPGVMSAGANHIHGKDAMTTEKSPSEKAKIDFAKQIVDNLDYARRQDKLHAIDIIAEPSMLGLLRDAMDNNLLKLVDKSVSKDGIGKSDVELLALIKKA